MTRLRHSPSRTPARTALVVALALVLTGCGGTADKENTMTPNEARAHLTETIKAVLEAAVPGGAPELDSSALNDGIPCGGLEGNEFNKIKHAVDAVTTRPAPDPEAAIVRMRATLDELGYTNGVDPDDGFQLLGFADAHGSGGIQVYQSGAVEVDAETVCLDNPDR